MRGLGSRGRDGRIDARSQRGAPPGTGKLVRLARLTLATIAVSPPPALAESHARPSRERVDRVTVVDLRASVRAARLDPRVRSCPEVAAAVAPVVGNGTRRGP